MFTKIKKEFAFFQSHPHNMRVLLLTNLVYALVLPVIELFIGAYIIRNSTDISLVMVFQLGQSAGIPLGFFLNGLLLTRIPVARLYSIGMLLSSLAMAFMMLLQQLNTASVGLAGILMGISYGFFWANRTFLTLTSTKNENRNYYYGLETFFNTIAVVLVPFLVGVYISMAHDQSWFGRSVNGAYYALTGGVFLLTVLASWIIHRGQFRKPVKTPFLYVRFHRLWRKMLVLSSLKGLAQGYIITAPVMLIMKLIGGEGALGSIQSAGALMTAGLLYFLGRKTKPEQRLMVFAAGLSLFLVGALINMALYSAAGVIFFVACLVLARPLLDLAYFPIQLGVVDFVAAREKRNEFTYIFTHELALFVGRMLGCGLFIALARFTTEDLALRYALPMIALLQFFSVFVAHSILNNRAWSELAEDDLQALGVLKAPIEL